VSGVRSASPNIALNRPASFGLPANDGATLPGKCVDGVVDANDNKCQTSAAGDYLQIDLGEPTAPKWFKLYNRWFGPPGNDYLSLINGFTLWSSTAPISTAQHDALNAGTPPVNLTLLHSDVAGGHQNDAAPYVIEGALAAGTVGRYVILHVRNKVIGLHEVEIGGVAAMFVPLTVRLSDLGDREFPSGGFAGVAGRSLQGILLRPIVGPRVLIEIMASVVGLGDTPWRSHGQKQQTDRQSEPQSLPRKQWDEAQRSADRQLLPCRLLT